MSATVVSLTKEQRKAVEARLSSVALSAGAGCGKTFVLTERFLADLEPTDDEGLFTENLDPAKLHELIAITFTDRAAREMRERIRKKCYERLQSASSQRHVNYWLKLLRSLDSARVSTIHAFCGALLRSNAVEAGLDPRFTVVEQAQADTLLAELIEDTLREKLNDHDDPLHQPILNLTEAFGLRRLQTMVSVLLRAGRSIEFAAWLARSPEQVVAIWDTVRRELVVPEMLSEIATSPSAAAVLKVISELNGDASGKLAERCKALAALLPSLPTSKRPAADLEEIIENAKIKGDGGVKAWPDPALRERFQAAADKLRKKANGAKKILEWDASAALADAKAGLELLALARTVSERYNRRKRELAWLDFNDLLQRTRQLLTDPAHGELQQRLASQVRLLLVDECQDTDAEQVELIKALSGGQIRGGNLYYVGDYKQSIYRFRGADPSVFRQLQEETPELGRLPLRENFRSQPAILNFVNALFCDVLSGGAEKSSTNGKPTLNYAPLIATRKQIVPEPAVEFLWSGMTAEETNDSDESLTTSARKQEAEFIARRIRAMIVGKEKIASDKQPDGTWAVRPVECKDIAILFRALSDVQYYEEALREYGIPYYLVGGHAFYAQQEIHDIVNLLRSLASSADTVSLAGVLRSPMFALTDDALFWLAQHPQGLAGGLFAGRAPSELSDSDRERVQFAAATLKHLRDRKDRVSITALLNESLALTGYDAALLAEFMGERKLANLRKLLEQARAFDRSGVFGLADFIVQLSDFVADMPREPLAATHPEGTDVVRLMTIHQSKGLEFPVVFVPDMNRKQQKNDDQVVWDQRLGPLVKVPIRRGKETLNGLDFYRELNDGEERAERVRLLYVATTRAADYLVLSSGMGERDFENPSAPWTKLLAERFDLETGRFIATLPSDKDYKTPLAKVTTELPATDSPTGVANPWPDLNGAIDKALEQAKKLESQAADGKLSASGGRDGPERLAEPILPDRSAQRRFSISRLNGHLQPLEEESSTALLLADDEQESVQTVAGAGGIDLGVLVHQALARIDFAALVKSDKDTREEAIRTLVNRYTDAGDKRSDDLADEAVQLVEHFLRSDLAGKLAEAKVVHRELEFLLAWPPGERKRGGVEEGNGSIQDGQYLQGFIDCLYQDAAGGWHIVDYKSNQVSSAAAKSTAAQFEMQLGVYALAVETILRQPPVELTVHFLRPSLDSHFVWNEGMRKNIIERVNQAITATVMSESPA